MTISVTYDYFEGLQEANVVEEEGEHEETFRKSGSIIEIPIRSSSSSWIHVACPVIIRDYMFAHSIWPSIINLKSSLDDLYPRPRLDYHSPFCQYLLNIPWNSLDNLITIELLKNPPLLGQIGKCRQ